jgi:hypothetical protein
MSADSGLRSRSGDAPAKVRVADLLRGAGEAAAPSRPPVQAVPNAPPLEPVLPAEPKALRREAGTRRNAGSAPRRDVAASPLPPTTLAPMMAARPQTQSRIAKVRPPKNTKKLLLLLALVSLGLAGALVPAYFKAGAEMRRTALATDLRFMNGASKRYRDDHVGRVPGLDDDSNVDGDRLVRQLTLPTDARGQVQPVGSFGPYLKSGIPPNPWNGSNGVKIVSTAALPSADDTTGWVYHVPTGQFVSNSRDGEH